MVSLIALLLVSIAFFDANQVNAHAHPIDQNEPNIVKNRLLLESAQIADMGMEEAKNMLLRAFSENITEADVVLAINDAMTDKGSSEYVEAFGVIVASGEQSAMPHGDVSDDEVNLILPGEVVVVDLGARYRGYCSDLTRTFFMGNATHEMMDIYNITLEAQIAGIEAVRAGVWARDVDKVARDVISSYGYGDNFTHGLGHGIGLYVHMPPILSPSSDGMLVKSGDMTITIEPGIYLEGRFGIRIEDDVFVQRNGYELLTFFPKGLEDAILYPEKMSNDSSSMGEENEKVEGDSDLLGISGKILLTVVVIITCAAAVALIVGLVVRKRKSRKKG